MKIEADPEVVSDMVPSSCPFCGHDGTFDGQGKIPDEIVIKRSGATTTTYQATWSQHRCPECNGRFQLLDRAKETDHSE